MNIKEKIYRKLPIFLQNFACYIEGRKISKRRYSKNFFSILDSIKTRDRLSQNELLELQRKRLKNQLIMAYENTIYYKKLFNKVNFNPYNFNDMNELKKLPIQVKEDIQTNIEIIVNNNKLEEEYILSNTSGTTGAGLVFPETKKCENEKWSIWWRYRLNNGINMNTWCAYFGGRSIVPTTQKKAPYWRIVKSTNQVMFSMYHLNETTVKEYVREINRRKLSWIHGYPSTISYLSSMMLEQKLKLTHEVTHVSIGSESLLESQKEIIKKVFGIYPIQHYGLTEPVANISQCEYGKLHVDEDYSYVEFIPVEGIENRYKVVGTSFANDALLFLRYNTNDIVSLANNQFCKCGRSGRIVSDIEGRKEDFLVQLDGTKIGRLDHIFKNMFNVKEAQIKQLKNKKVIFYVVKNYKYTIVDEQLLIKEIEERLSIDYNIEYVDNIKKTKNGKLKFVISEIE